MSEFEDRLTRDLADLAYRAIPSERPIPPLPRSTPQPRRFRQPWWGSWWPPALAAALVIVVVGAGLAITQSNGKGDARPATTTSVSPSPSAPSVTQDPPAISSTTPSATSSTTPSAASSGSGVDPAPPAVELIRFDGFGSVALGATSAELLALGYTAQAPLSDGCVAYVGSSPSGVLLDPRIDEVVSISPPKTAATEAGLAVGATADAVLAAYAGYQVQDLRNREFGQGSNGVLVTSAAGSIGFATDNDVVVLIEIGKDDYATAMEVGCGGYGQTGQS